MYFKYKKIVIDGANGTTITHRSDEDNEVFTLGDIDGFTYIYSPSALANQNDKLIFTKVSLSVLDIQNLELQRFVQGIKEENFLLSWTYANVEAVVQKMIEDSVTAMGYDDENSISKYLVVGNAYYEECKSLSIWIGLVWEDVNKYKNGEKEFTTIEALIAGLPVRV